MIYHRNSDGVIEFDEFAKNKSFILLDSKKYYYKDTNISEMFNELIGSVIAEEYGIDHLKYINVVNEDGFFGVISEDFANDFTYLSMDSVFKDIIGLDYIGNYQKYNNLKDINLSIETKFNLDLSDFVSELFLFDSLTANSDRHPSNYGFLIKDGIVKPAPVFDNEMLLSEDGLDSLYGIKVNRNDGYPYDYDIESNYLYKFFQNYGQYKDFYFSKLPIISDTNILRIIERVEDESKTLIPKVLKKGIIENFKCNNRMINEVMKKTG